MKIGLVIYGSLDIVSGGYLYDRKLVRYLESHGDPVQIVSLPTGSYFSHLLQNLTARLPAQAEVIIEDELVHPSLLLANRMLHRVPLVSLVHNLHASERRPAWQNRFYRMIEKRHIDSVDGFIFNSIATRDSVHALGGIDKPYVIAPPGGDRLGRLSRETVLQRAARPGRLRIAFVASVTPLKGLDVLLAALKDFPPGTCTLDVAGSLTVDREYAARMQAQAAGLPMPINFHGTLSDQPLAALLSQCDVLVLPSYYEGFGIAYLEGMAFGLPAIGTRVGAIPQMISGQVNGYLIAPGDSAALGTIIRRLALDRALLAQLSQNALDYFASQATWDDSAEMIRGFLRKMMRG